MDCTMSGFPVLHYLPEFAKTHVPLNQWCHLTISSSVISSSCPQPFSASGSFQINHLFALGGQSIGTSASVQFSSATQLCPTLCDPMNHSTPGLPVHNQFLEFTQTHVHWVGDTTQPSHLCCPLLLLPSVFPSIRIFSNEATLHIRWPKYWSFSFSKIGRAHVWTPVT